QRRYTKRKALKRQTPRSWRKNEYITQLDPLGYARNSYKEGTEVVLKQGGTAPNKAPLYILLEKEVYTRAFCIYNIKKQK
ncbi:MAG: hypothetical protein WDZ70_02045, partial [Candidatus Paceibacterota bacterium]